MNGSDAGQWSEVLHAVIGTLATDLDLPDALHQVAALVTDATAFDACLVHLVDEGHRRVALAAATPPFEAQVGSDELALGEGVAGWVAAHGVPVLGGHTSDFGCQAAVPVLRGGRVLGAVEVRCELPHEVAPEELAALTDVARLLGGAVEHARLSARLVQREAALEGFAARIIEVQEAERRRLARDIHDGISQRLVGLWFHLDAVATADPTAPDEAARELAAARELVVAALAEAREAIMGLRPQVLDDLGLAAGLESLARSYTGIEVRTDVEPCPLDGHVEAALYRIAQEALHNAARHAPGSAVRLALRAKGDGARLSVADDGDGFDVARVPVGQHYGLAGMRERAELAGGRLEVSSRSGRGTIVSVTVPLAASMSDE